METRKRLLSILLTLAMILSMAPGMSLFAYAESSTSTYKLVSSVTNGKNYLIVSSNSGSGYALKNSSGTVAATESLTINEATDTIGAAYIETSDEDAVWAAEGSDSSFTFKNGNYYIYLESSGNGKSATRTLTLSESSTSWSAENENALCYSGKQNSYYITYSSGWTLSTSKASVYLFEEVSEEEETTTPSITLNKSTLSLAAGKSSTLTATTENTGDSEVSWTSSDTGVATVSDGTITAVAAGTATITAAITVDSTEYTATCEVTVKAADNKHYIAVASDRHSNETAIGSAMTGMPDEVEYVCLNGDLVNNTNAYNTSTILGEVQDVFGKDNMTSDNVDIVYGSHDAGATDDAKIMNCTTSNSSGLLYTGENSDGSDAYYVYGVAYDDMICKTATDTTDAATAFMDWVDEKATDTSVPIIVISHVPLHYQRNDNGYAVAWDKALNYAATGTEEPDSDDTVIRNIVFLHGHNHTTESNCEYYIPAGSTIKIFDDEHSSDIGYTYTTAGYLNANTTATLITIEDGAVTIDKYQSGEVTSTYASAGAKTDFSNTYDTAATHTIAATEAADAVLTAKDIEAAKVGSDGEVADQSISYTFKVNAEGATSQGVSFNKVEDTDNIISSISETGEIKFSGKTGSATVTLTGTYTLSGETKTLTKTISVSVNQYYTVTFEANNDDAAGSMSDQTVAAATATALTANAFKLTNYKFSGWNTKSDGSGTSYANKASVELNEDLTLYAQWTERTGTELTYDYVDESDVETDSEYVVVSNGYALVNYDGTITAAEAEVSGDTVTVEDTDISGNEIDEENILWTISSSGDLTNNSYYLLRSSGTGSKAATIGTSDTGSAYSDWDYDGEQLTLTGGSSSSTTYYLYYDTDNSAWYTSTSTSYTAMLYHDSSSDTYLKADDISVNVDDITDNYSQTISYKFKVNGVAQSSVTFSTTDSTVIKSISDDGVITFTGNVGSATVTLTGTYTENEETKTLTKDITVTVVQYYTVSFNANSESATGTMSTQTIAAETATALTANAFKLSGKRFSGWNTAEDGTGTSYADGQEVTLSGDLTLYAQWTEWTDQTYKLVDSITSGNTYLVVNVNEAGQGHVLSYDGSDSTVADTAVTISSGYFDDDTTATPYIVTKNDYAAWTVTKSSGSYKFANYGDDDYYLYCKSGAVSVSTSSSKWKISDDTLYYSSSSGKSSSSSSSSSTKYYITYSSDDGWTVGTDSTNVYFYELTSETPDDGTTPGISLDQSALSLTVGGTGTLTATTKNAGDATVDWSSSDDSVATVSDGTVTAVTAGTATITASITVDSVTYKATCTVTVKESGSEDDSNIYVLTSSIENGKKYLIVNTNTAGAAHALSISDSSMADQSVTIEASGSDLVIKDPASATVWTASGSESTFTFANGNNYLYYAKKAISISTSSYEWTVSAGDGSLYTYSSNAKKYYYPSYADSAWSTESDSSAPSGNAYLYVKTSSGDTTSYTVTFNSNGGSDVDSQTVESGSTATEPTAPTKEGYTFGGWYSDEELTTAYDFSTAVTDDLTLYAKWTANTYTVKFDANDGSGTMADQSFTYDTEQALTANAFTRENYTFSGWATSTSGSVEYSDGATVKNLTAEADGTITLYAVWTKNGSYTVTFNSNGGSDVASQTVTSGSTATKPTAPTKEGYTFGGWYSDSALTSEYDFSTAVTANITLYAKWTENQNAMTVAASGYSSTYDGEEHSITVSVTTPESGATVKYGTTEGTYDLTSAPAYTNAGTYTVYYQVTATGYTTVTGSETVAIAKADSSVTAAPTAKTLTYTGEAQALVTAGTASGGTMQYSTDGETYSADIPTGTNAASYTVYYKVAGDDNHKDTDAASVSATIAKASNSVTVSIDGWTYGGTASTPSVTASFGGDTAAFTYSSSADGDYTETVPTDAGTYYVKATIAGTDNYGGATGTASFTIAKADPTVSAPKANTLTYTGSEQALVTAGSTSGGTMSYSPDGETYSSDIPTGTNAGTYTVYYKVTGDDNYNDVAAKTLSVTIATAAMDLTVEGYSGTYDGDSHGITVDVDTPEGAVIAYGTSRGTYDLEESPTYTDAGSYTVYYQVTADNYTTVTSSATVTISKASLSNVSVAQTGTLTYNGSEQTATVTTAATAVNDQDVTFTYSTANGGTYSDTVPAFTNAGTHTVYYKAGADNHNSTQGSFTVTIGKADSSAVITGLTDITYTGEAQALATEEKVVGGTVLYSLTGANADDFTEGVSTAVNAGSYTVYWKIEESSNYNGSNGSVTAAISTKAMTIAAEGYNAAYDGAAHGITVTVSEPNGATVKYGTTEGTYSETSSPTYTNVGEYTVYYQATADNYTETTGSAVVKITQASNTVTVSIDGWTYGEDANSPSSTANFGTDTVTYTYSDASDGEYTSTVPTTAGTWYVKASIAETANYAAAENAVSFDIAKAESSVSAAPTANTLTYSGEAQALVAAGTAEGGTMMYSLDGETYSEEIPTATAADDYTVYYYVAGDSNHKDTEVSNVAVSIAKAEAEVTSPEAASGLVYSAEAQTLITEGTTEDGTLYYAVSSDGENAPSEGWSSTAPEESEAGTYYVWYKTEGDSNHEDVDPACVSVSIGKAALTITANDNTIYYGSAPADDGVSTEGLKGSDSLDELDGSLSYTYTYEKNGKPGTYNIAAGGLSSDNYSIVYKPGTLTVKDKVSVIAVKAKASGKKAFKFTWNAVTGAATYELYFGKCGKSAKKIATVTKTSYTKKKLAKSTCYRYYVIAKDEDGNKLATSLSGHAITGNVKGKYTNAKSLSLDNSTAIISLGKGYNITPSQKKVKSGKTLLSKGHAALYRYKSDNTEVATVNSKGQVTAVGTGWCRIYVQTVNGIWKTVTINVIE